MLWVDGTASMKKRVSCGDQLAARIAAHQRAQAPAILAMKDGTGALGIVRSETRDELVLALPGGAVTKLRKRDIAKRDKFPTSMMPSGLNQALTQEDLVDLVEYLASLKAK